MTQTALYDVTPEARVPGRSVETGPRYFTTFAHLTLSDLDRIEHEWEELTKRGGFSEPFFQPYWFRSFLETFHARRPAPFVLVREGDELKGILPLMHSRRFWGRLPARALKSLSGIHSCRFDFICESHNKDKIAEAAWRALEEDTSWTVIEAQSVPEGGGFEALMRHADRNGYLVARWPTLLSPYLNVPTGANDGLQNCPARYKKDRNRVKSKLKKLREQGEVAFEVLEHFDEEFFQEFLRLEGAGWKGKAGGAIRCNPTIVEFYRRMLNRADAARHLRMCALKLNGKRIAMELALVSKNTCFSPKIAYNEELSKFGPGQIMALFAIQDLAHRGIEKYDLLGPRARYKALWAGDVRAHANCFIFRPNLVGTAYYLFATRVAPLVRRAKHRRYGDPQSLGEDAA